jgi:hypothetical protein
MMEPTNLLLIMADEHNPQMLGCAGHSLVHVTTHNNNGADPQTCWVSDHNKCK